MANEQKIFLKALRKSWSVEFPSIKSAGEDAAKRRPENCNFVCDDCVASKARYYFLQFDFSRKRRGEFSIIITISKSRADSILSASEDQEPTPQSVGAFGVWQFMRKPWKAWSLVDLEAESMVLLGFPSGLPKKPRCLGADHLRSTARKDRGRGNRRCEPDTTHLCLSEASNRNVILAQTRIVILTGIRSAERNLRPAG